MNEKKRILFAWSGGKDSAMALHKIQQEGCYEIAALLTTVTEDYDRISMHGVRRVLLEQQAESLGIPLEIVYLTKNSSNEEYDSRMRETLLQYKNKADVSSVCFGDIFLEDIREYRENNLSKAGMDGIFPLWKRNTTELAHEFMKKGFKSIITCIDSNAIDKKFAGRKFDEDFLNELPEKVDPCGENGEFHSFVYDGPIFQKPIAVETGEIVLRHERFYFCDLLPVKDTK